MTPAEYMEVQARGGIVNLSQRTLFRFTGSDRVRFLNGQVSANVSRIAEGESIPACVTSAKGRLDGVVLVRAGEGALWVDSEPELRESLHARLERYIVSDDVEIEDLSDQFATIHLIPPRGEAADPARAAALAGLERPNVSLVNRFGRAGVDIVIPAVAKAEVVRKLAVAFVELTEPMVETLRVEAGIPKWGRELDEQTLPQEAGLERTHIDFQKGCYIGQEVISRLRSVGHVNRQLTGLVEAEQRPGNSSPLLARGMALFPIGADGPQAGIITSAVYSFALAKPIALGYLKRGSARELLARHPQSAEHPSLDGIPVIAHDLPFPS